MAWKWNPSVTDRIETRLFVEDDLAEGVSIGLDHARAHFLRSVLRLGTGAAIALFNGRDGEWLARLEGLGKGWASLSVERRRRPQPGEADRWLVFAPITRARIDFLAEKATELGVTALLPVATRFTAVSRVNLERLAANAREAAEQCRRLTVPEVRPVRDLFALMADWPAERRLLVCAESGDAVPLAAALRDLGSGNRSATTPWAVMTGPEGGFADSELDGLRKLPFATMVGLGRRVLRADTAALAALATWQALLGDAEERPPEA